MKDGFIRILSPLNSSLAASFPPSAGHATSVSASRVSTDADGDGVTPLLFWLIRVNICDYNYLLHPWAHFLNDWCSTCGFRCLRKTLSWAHPVFQLVLYLKSKIKYSIWTSIGAFLFLPALAALSSAKFSAHRFATSWWRPFLVWIYSSIRVFLFLCFLDEL